MSEGQGESAVAQVGKDIYSAAVARCSQDLKAKKTYMATPPAHRPVGSHRCSETHLALWGCWLLVEAQAEQPRGGARHLGLELPTQLPVIDTAALAGGQDLWRTKQRCGGQV